MSAISSGGGGTGGKVGGADKQVQFNDAGTFAGIPEFTFDKTSKVLGVNGSIAIGATPAQSGAIRLSNFGSITSRNVANTADLGMVYTANDNSFRMGDAGNPVAFLMSPRLELVGGGRITFPSTQTPSTDAGTLDDYKEIPFTPTLTGTGGSTGQIYVVQAGFAIKIGRFVHFGLRLSMSALGTLSGSLVVAGLPVATSGGSATGDYLHGANCPYYSGLAGAIGGLSMIVNPGGATTGALYFTPASGSAMSQNLTAASCTNSFDFVAVGSYIAAQ